MIKVYTDGGLSKKNGVGGWAAVLVYSDGTRKGICGAYEGADVTNNLMEFRGVIEALKFVAFHHEGEDIEIISDSEYLVKGTNEWSTNWIEKGWKCSTGPVKNVKLWVELLGLLKLTKAKLSWIRGHDGNPDNEMADKLAVNAYKKVLNARRDVSHVS